jgi:hypothetical protein
MGRQRHPGRDESKRKYLESNGTISAKELADAAGVTPERISKWKCEDKWNEALKKQPKKKGGQRGNKNAKGKTPAKRGNRNAVSHGAYVKVRDGDISSEKRQKIAEMLEGESLSKMMEELQSLYTRKAYLEGLMEKYTDPNEQGTYYADKIVHMIVPKSLEERREEMEDGIVESANDPEGNEGGSEIYKTTMKSIIKSSTFDRAMKVEAELNRLHGRIIKLLDSIKSYEIEDRRIILEEKKYNLAKQRIAGVFEYDEENEEIVDIDGNMKEIE